MQKIMNDSQLSHLYQVPFSFVVEYMKYNQTCHKTSNMLKNCSAFAAIKNVMHSNQM